MCAIERSKIDVMLKEGKTESQILDYYATAYGGNHVFGEPPAEGSGRIAWSLPLVIGAGGFLTIAYLARRWSRRPAFAGAAGVEDPAMAARLDDELRDLD
jgi:cytochrome c-type biogenesis protein CcmH